LVVVDQADEWTLLGNLGEQAQDAEPDQKRVRGGPCTEAERGAQRVALRDREAFELIEHRRAQLMQPGEGELHLRLDRGGTRDATAGGAIGHVIQQRGFAGARLTVHYQSAAFACAHSLDEVVKHFALGAAVHQLRRTRPRREACGYPHAVRLSLA
jgi:hypothetical protein